MLKSSLYYTLLLVRTVKGGKEGYWLGVLVG